MPGVKQRVADYEAMIAKKNGSSAEPLKDGLSDPLQQEAPSSKPTSLNDLTPEQSLEWQIAIRQPYRGPEDLKNLPEWMRPFMAVHAAEPNTEAGKEARKPKKPKKKSKKSEDAPAAAAAPEVTEQVSPPPPGPPSAKEIWKGVPPAARIPASPGGLDVGSADVFYVHQSVMQSIPILTAQPHSQPHVAAVMGLTPQLMNVYTRLLNIEVQEAVPGADLKSLARERMSAMATLQGLTTTLSAFVAATPAVIYVDGLSRWSAQNVGELVKRLA